MKRSNHIECKLIKNKLYFEEDFYIDLNRETIEEYELTDIESISFDIYSEIIKRRAKSMAYFLLSKKDYFSKELEKKLVEKYKERDMIVEVIDELVQNGYIDDYESARIYINNHNYGRKKMEFMLFQKGVSTDVIREILDENTEKEEKEIEKQLLKMEGKEDRVKIEKLIRKGFEYSKIRGILQRIKDE